MRICVLSGTNRQGSATLRVARWVAGLHEARGSAVDLLDLRDLPAECLSPTAYADKPAALQPLVDKVLAADGLVVVSPEYNGGFPGVLKLFIDMLPFPEALAGRPVSFVGLSAGRWGALRPVEQLQLLVGYRQAIVHPERVFVPGVGGAIDSDGVPTSDELAGRFARQADSFQEFCLCLRLSVDAPAEEG